MELFNKLSFLSEVSTPYEFDIMANNYSPPELHTNYMVKINISSLIDMFTRDKSIDKISEGDIMSLFNDMMDCAIRYRYLVSNPDIIPATIPVKVFLSKLDEYTKPASDEYRIKLDR